MSIFAVLTNPKKVLGFFFGGGGQAREGIRRELRGKQLPGKPNKVDQEDQVKAKFEMRG